MRLFDIARPFVAAALVAVAASSALAAEPAPIRRVAFIVGANDGGREYVKLRYAESDAKEFASVLEKLGGVSPTDRILLLSPDKQRFLAGVDDLERLLRAQAGAAKRTELVVYYSGHSDEDGLLLGESLLTYGDFRKKLEALPADVRIAVLDSCASGAMTRHKGGTWRPPFMVDDSSQVQGHAFLTSSAENEAAQESDRIGGSFFTHYLVSGLRGAADASHDGRVTLSEAYQFAFNETLARTEQTQSGAQHPAFDIQLSGTGDLVMTDLRGSSAHVVVESEVDGRLFLRGQDGRLAAELRKSAGRAVELGVDGGTYAATLQQADGTVLVAKVTVADGARASLPAKAFSQVPKEWAVARGGAMVDPIAIPPHEVPGDAGIIEATPPPEPPVAPEPPPAPPSPPLQNDGKEANLTPPGPSQPARSYAYTPLHVTLLPDLCLVHDDGERVFTNVSLHLVGGDAAVVRGVQAGLGGAFIRESLYGVQFSPLLTWIDGEPPAPGAARPQSGGLQLSGFGNYAGGRMTGAQLSGLTNVTVGFGRGVQLAGGANFLLGDGAGFSEPEFPAGHFSVQLAGGLNVARGHFYGVQLSGLANVIQAEKYAGAGPVPVLAGQLGAVNLVRGDLAGVQLGGLDIVGDTVRGAQAGMVNVNGGLSGVQVGLVNVGGDVKGAQIGLVNIADNVKGVQLGLVNVSDEISGVPVGVVNYTKGGLHLDAWGGSSGWLAGGSVVVGGSWLYSLGTVMFEHNCTLCGEEKEVHALLGLGLHVPLGRVFALTVDGSAGMPLGGSASVSGLARAGVVFMPFRHFGVILGGYAFGKVRRVDPEPLSGDPMTPADRRGFYAGLRF